MALRDAGIPARDYANNRPKIAVKLYEGNLVYNSNGINEEGRTTDMWTVSAPMKNELNDTAPATSIGSPYTGTPPLIELIGNTCTFLMPNFTLSAIFLSSLNGYCVDDFVHLLTLDVLLVFVPDQADIVELRLN